MTRVAQGGALSDVLRDLALMVEKPAKGEMLASILIVSEDGERLLEGAAPSLPEIYNEAIHGIAIGPNVGSCGSAAFSGEPVYVEDIASDPRWANFKDLAQAHNLAACWSTPIKSADGRVLGTFANYYREPKAPTARDIEVISMVAQTTALAIERHRLDLARSRAEQRDALLVQELNHRIKNVFALAHALLSMSAASAKNAEEALQAAKERLSALSRAHNLILPGATSGVAADAPPTLLDLAQKVLAPYVLDDIPLRVSLSGPEFALAPGAITDLALLLHELACNAAKYGALSVTEGRVSLSWDIAGGELSMHWRESNGPAVAAPGGAGFGSKLVLQTVERQYGGAIEYSWRQDGLEVELVLPTAPLLAPVANERARP